MLSKAQKGAVLQVFFRLLLYDSAVFWICDLSLGKTCSIFRCDLNVFRQDNPDGGISEQRDPGHYRRIREVPNRAQRKNSTLFLEPEFTGGILTRKH
jgi:hypothetical protein